jgi:drug/metabolite transporter (DMT)-like permease
VNDRIFLGLALRLLAMLCMSTMSALIKLTETRGVTLVEAMFYRQLWALPLVTGWVALAPGGLASLRTRRFGAHFSRTVVGLMGMVFTFGSVMLLPLAEATTFQFTVPIFATLLGALVLRERTGGHRWAAVVAGFVGVLVVAHPSGANFDARGTVVGLLAALFVAIVAILLRQIGRTESAGTTVFWFSALSVVLLAPVYAFQARAHDRRPGACWWRSG